MNIFKILLLLTVSISVGARQNLITDSKFETLVNWVTNGNIMCWNNDCDAEWGPEFNNTWFVFLRSSSEASSSGWISQGIDVPMGSTNFTLEIDTRVETNNVFTVKVDWGKDFRTLNFQSAPSSNTTYGTWVSELPDIEPGHHNLTIQFEVEKAFMAILAADNVRLYCDIDGTSNHHRSWTILEILGVVFGGALFVAIIVIIVITVRLCKLQRHRYHPIIINP